MKKIYISKNKLDEMLSRKPLNEGSPNGDYRANAGTDFPCFYDEKTDTWYEASWNGDYGFPFGFWSKDYYGEDEVFSVGDAWTTHAQACGKVAEEYFSDLIYEQVGTDVSTIADKVNDLLSDIKEYNCFYDENNDVYISDDASLKIDLWEEADSLGLNFIDYDKAHTLLEQGIAEGGLNESALSQEIMEQTISEQNFSTRDGIDDALQLIGDSFDDFFERGNSEGRIWPEKEMIGFYDTEQPDPETLLYILRLLSEYSEIGVSYNEMLNFHMVFEDWRTSDGIITCCTISDYVDGNYGPNSYEEENDEDEVQYARQGKTVFVPHLANQEDKRAFFKDFRDTRDKAVYAPREKAAGNLAAYHAMRYPYGENKERINQIIKEVIDKQLKERH